VTGLKLVEQDPPMTLYHLITHTSGLSYGWSFDTPVDELYRQVVPTLFERSNMLAQVIEQLAKLPLVSQPGTRWRYSYATDVLGYVIQIVADMPLADFLEERIFKPLGMIDTGFSVPAHKCDRLAQIYMSPTLYDPLIAPHEVTGIRDVTTPTNCPSGGGGLVSTLADYLAFCNCLLNEGKYEGGMLLGRKTLAWMTADHIPASWHPLNINADILDHSFGMGFAVRTSLGQLRSLNSVGTYSWGGAAQTMFLIDPTEALIVLMMTQHLPTLPYPVQERFRTLAYQAVVD
jgi:CubicO group peptidase (beta-lactamase class C family)